MRTAPRSGSKRSGLQGDLMATLFDSYISSVCKLDVNEA
jgi:hypothetical protein